MAESNFELWVKGCEINHTEIYCLDGSGDHGVYQTRSRYMMNHVYYYNSPVFHVWINGKWLASTTNYHSAMGAWNNNKGGDLG